jgi:hypothetical protein
MIKALRYWSDAMGLTVETKDAQGIQCIETHLFQAIYEHDLYLQDIGSLWLLHRELAINEAKATAWYWAFNEQSKLLFTKEEFVNEFYAFTVRHGASYNKTTYSKEFDCFKNTYVSDATFDVKKIIEEDTIPFFAPLGLIITKDGSHFERPGIKATAIPINIFYYFIIKDNEDHLADRRQISIDTLLGGNKQVGKYLSLSYSTLLDCLQMLENRGKLRLINNFGNRHIEINNKDTNVLLHDYYRMVGR